MVAQVEVEEPYNKDFDASNRTAVGMAPGKASDGSTHADR
jgi:hypothetical protein